MKFIAFALLFVVFVANLPATGAQDKYAVVVGVETYDTGTFDPLEYANEDAKGLKASLATLGFRAQVMTSDATSSTLRPSSPQKIMTVVRTVASSCGPGDTLLISLSGHGVQFVDEPLLPSGVHETYFCPEDASLSDKSSLLKISSLIQFLSESKASRKLLLIDACRESVLSENGRKKSAKRIDLGSVHENRDSVPGGIAVLFSCSSKQFSWEHPDLGHSVFSKYVIDYLSGNADDRFYENANADLDGLVFYVRKRTNDFVYSRNLSAEGQLPVLRGESANWSLGKVQERAAREFTNGIGIQFVRVQAGEFQMGNEESVAGLRAKFPGSSSDSLINASPQHTIRISSPFYMAKHEVTVGQFRRFVQNTNYRTEAETDGKGGWGFEGTRLNQSVRFNWKNTGFPQTDAHPVVNVSWNDAKSFVTWLNKQDEYEYSLPTEAQWEYACRAGSMQAYSFGDDAERLVTYGNAVDGTAFRQLNFQNAIRGEDGYAYTAPVGRFQPNSLGLFDMHGNAWEWCSDWFSPTYYSSSPRSDPRGPQTGETKVFRGGGSLDGGAEQYRSAYRNFDVPSLRFLSIGFRVIRTR